MATWRNSEWKAVSEWSTPDTEEDEEEFPPLDDCWFIKDVGGAVTVPVLWMRCANAGKIPDWQMIDRELQKVAAMLTACEIC